MWRLFIKVSDKELQLVPFHNCPSVIEHEGKRYNLYKADIKKSYGLYYPMI